MKKLLFQLDTDPHPSVFDTIVGYDSGADQVIGLGGVSVENARTVVEGAIFTRSPKEKKNTALFIGGSNMQAGDALLKAVNEIFFANFRVSVMLDSNGSNTTAAAGVAKLLGCCSLEGKNAVVVAGTGPVGTRAAVMMAKEGAMVSLTSRSLSRAEEACQRIKERFDVQIRAVAASTNDERGMAIADAHVVFATGAAGVQLLELEHWQNNSKIQVLADANATPPLGIGGTDMMDRGERRNGKISWGAIGFGSLKLTLHKACIVKLFEKNDQVFDTEEIFELAKLMKLGGQN